MRKGRPLAALAISSEDRTQLMDWSRGAEDRPGAGDALAHRSAGRRRAQLPQTIRYLQL